jgi:hypothetical protein
MRLMQAALMLYLIYLYSTELTPGQPMMHIMLFSWIISWLACWVLKQLWNALRWAYCRLTSRTTFSH